MSIEIFPKREKHRSKSNLESYIQSQTYFQLHFSTFHHELESQYSLVINVVKSSKLQKRHLSDLFHF